MELIPVVNLLYMLLPLLVVGYCYFKWSANATEVLYATIRMVLQLILIGYLLLYIFSNNALGIGIAVVIFMIMVSSYIALRNITDKNFKNYLRIVISIGLSGTFNLFIVLYFVLELTPLYEPRFVIPIAGMIYANAMNAVSLAAERFEKEILHVNFNEARSIALKSALIPTINSFLAVGLVSLPGMMTGQILSGIDPLIAVRYQIVVMAMVLGSSGIGVILYLLQKKQ